MIKKIIMSILIIITTVAFMLFIIDMNKEPIPEQPPVSEDMTKKQPTGYTGDDTGTATGYRNCTTRATTSF